VNSLITLVWLSPVLFMIHDFEEIIIVGAWKKKYSNVIKLSKPKKVPFSDFVSTESFSCGVAEEFLLLTIVSLLSCIFGNYFLWFALFFAFVLHLVIHFVLCIRFGHYVPGLLTSVIFFPIGILILIAFMIDANFHLISIIVPSMIGTIVFLGNILFLHRMMKTFDNWIDKLSIEIKNR
jgi:hypothetical protein